MVFFVDQFDDFVVTDLFCSSAMHVGGIGQDGHFTDANLQSTC